MYVDYRDYGYYGGQCGCCCCSCCRPCNAPYYPLPQTSQTTWTADYGKMIQQAQEEAAKQPKADIMLADLTPQVLMHNTKDSKTNELPELGS